jgi:phosphoribosylformimino-5-aminoimidazole carboxamide ribotide isomerase
MIIIPSIDIKEGKVVRLIQGNPDKEIISIPNPEQVAAMWKEKGAKLVHVVDIDAAFGKENQMKIIEKVINSGPKATVGGGIRDFKTAEFYIKMGAYAVVISTMFFENEKDFFKLQENYPDKIILALDFDEQFNISIRGWQNKAKLKLNDKSQIEKLNLYKIKGFLFTAVFRDGTSKGVAREHFRTISEVFKITETKDEKKHERIFIASGGINSYDDLKFLKALGFWGAVVGRAFYEGKINVFEI